MSRYFADLSNNNTQPVDFAAYRKAGHRLLGLKATEATSFVDPYHAARSEAAHEAGIWVMHYHFGHPSLSVIDQVKFFWDTVKPYAQGDDFYCLDIEPGENRELFSGLTIEQVAEFTQSFDTLFRGVAAHSMVGYSNQSTLEELVRAAKAPLIHGSRWWIAAYGPRKPQIRTVETWAWQFTDGVEGPDPHVLQGIGQSDVSLLNRATYDDRLILTRPSKAGARPAGKGILERIHL